MIHDFSRFRRLLDVPGNRVAHDKWLLHLSNILLGNVVDCEDFKSLTNEAIFRCSHSSFSSAYSTQWYSCRWQWASSGPCPTPGKLCNRNIFGLWFWLNYNSMELKSVQRLGVIWGQCCLRVAASPCLPNGWNGPITLLSPYLPQNPWTRFGNNCRANNVYVTTSPRPHEEAAEKHQEPDMNGVSTVTKLWHL